MVVELLSLSRESVIVVMDANRTKGNVDAVDWAIKNVVQPRDTVVVIGVLQREFGKKNSCFPFHMGISISGIWEKIELSLSGSEMNPKDLEEEIEKKREEYQCILQPFYRQCKRNEVKLEVKLAAGYEPCEITIEEAQNNNTRWIVLDSHLKKEKVFIYGHVGCNVAVMKGKDLATVTLSKAPTRKRPIQNDGTASMPNQQGEMQDEHPNSPRQDRLRTLAQPPQSPCWYPLSWRTGFPRAFTQNELQVITDGFADENVVLDKDGIKVYQGILQEIPVVVQCFSETDERFWSMLKILSRVRHCNILSLVGYCCAGDLVYLLCDYPCRGTLASKLQCDESAKNLTWKTRWYIALEIGASLRYLHEECVDGPIVHNSVSSSHIVFSHGCSAMLSNFAAAKWLKDDVPCNEDSLLSKCTNLEEDECLYIDVRAFGVFLVELITGKSALSFQAEGQDQSLIDWALPHLENDSLTQVMDPRLIGTSDAEITSHMAKAALHCLKNDSSGHRPSISEVLAMVRGDLQYGSIKFL